MKTKSKSYYLIGQYYLTVFHNSWLIIGFVTRLTQRMPLVEKKRFTLPDHLRSSPVVTRSLVVGVCFEDHCLSICLFLAAIVLSVLPGRFNDKWNISL
jgi:hypothetical protein